MKHMPDLRVSRRQSLRTLAAATALGAPSAGAAMPAVRLVVLDVGGTIVEERGDVPETLRRAFSNHGLTVTPAEIGEWRGASKREVVRHFVERYFAERHSMEQSAAPGDANREKLTAAIYRDFSARIIEVYKTVPPIAGAEEAFRKMRGDGLLLATTTGFDREITDSIFHRLGWQKYFAATISSDDVAQGRPSPFMIFHAMEAARVNGVREVVAVGDTPLDLQAGTNAGLRGVVGVLSGASTSAKLDAEPHTHILPSVAGLPALLRAGI
jgi:phosphonatase-like hydrolase